MIAIKVTTVGNSSGIVLPKEVLKKLRVHRGDTIYLVETPEGFRITPYDEEFAGQMEAAESIMHEDRDVLRALAK